jgi:hypothetical protein
MGAGEAGVGLLDCTAIEQGLAAFLRDTAVSETLRWACGAGVCPLWVGFGFEIHDAHPT